MKPFEFKKPYYEIEKEALETFNSLFWDIKSDTFLIEGFKSEIVSLKKDKEDFLEYCEEGEKYPQSKEFFTTEEYESKMKKYQEFVNWVKQEHNKKSVLGLVYCPYSNEIIEKEFFPLPYFLSKSSLQVNSGWQSVTLYKIKPMDLFKRGSNTIPERNVSKKALNLFFSYWSYDVLNKVSLNAAKDGNLLKVDSKSGTIYYSNGDETWTNQLYYGPKGFFVKMKNKRIPVPCPSYPNLEEDLSVLASRGQPLISHDRYPTIDEKIIQAISFGVLDSGLAPKKENEKKLIVQKIEKWIDGIEKEEDFINVYEKIQKIMSGNNI